MVSQKNRILGMLFFSALLLALMLLIPQTISLSKGGFDEQSVLDKFQFYEVTGLGFLIGIWVIYFIEFFVKSGDNRYGNSLGFYSIGDSPSLSIFKRLGAFQLTLISLIIFTIVGLFTFVNTSQSFTGVLFLESQQFTVVDSILFSAALIPLAENLGAGFVMALSLLFLRKYARKNNWGSQTFIILSYFIVPLLTGLFGIAWHMSRYPGSEIKLAIVFGFWFIGAFITLITGFFMPFAIMHFANNLFIDLSRYFSNEIMLFRGGIVIAVLIVCYVLLYGLSLKSKKNNSNSFE